MQDGTGLRAGLKERADGEAGDPVGDKGLTGEGRQGEDDVGQWTTREHELDVEDGRC